MKPVTTGPGISGTFNDGLVALILNLRTQTKNQGWRLYIEALRSDGYSLRVYAPDHHTEVHAVRKGLKTIPTIDQILATESNSWQSRVRAAAALITD